MSAIASQITSLTIIYSTVYSDADQRKHQSSASLVFVWGIHREPVNSPHKWPVTRIMFPFDDVIMSSLCLELCWEDKHVRHLISSSKWEASIYANTVIFSVPVSEVCVEMIGRIMVSRSYSLVCTFNHNIIIIQNCTSIEHIKRSVVRYALFGVRQDKSNYFIYLLCSICFHIIRWLISLVIIIRIFVPIVIFK